MPVAWNKSVTWRGLFRQHIVITHSAVSAYWYMLVSFWTSALGKSSWFYASLVNKTKLVKDLNHDSRLHKTEDLSTNDIVPTWQPLQKPSMMNAQNLGFWLHDPWSWRLFSANKRKKTGMLSRWQNPEECKQVGLMAFYLLWLSLCSRLNLLST